MNFISSIFADRKNSIVACAIFVALILIPQSIRAQTSAAANALQFSNADTVAPDEPDLPPPWTAEMWVNRADASGSPAALFNSSVAALKLEQFGSPNRNVGVSVYGVGDYYFNYTVPTNTWTHLAFVGTSNGVSLYFNGVLTDSLAVPISLPLMQLGSLTANYLNATVDEVKLVNKGNYEFQAFQKHQSKNKSKQEASGFRRIDPIQFYESK